MHLESTRLWSTIWSLALSFLFFTISSPTFAFVHQPSINLFDRQDHLLSLDKTEEKNAFRSIFVLPGEVVKIESEEDVEGAIPTEDPLAGKLEYRMDNWQWTAPDDVGVYALEFRQKSDGAVHRVHAFVMHPASGVKKGKIGKFTIGNYPKNAGPGYEAPRGFIQVTEENENTLVSPHFRLKQFICKQAGGYPKYLALSERLLLKLEMLLAKARENGFPGKNFVVMSGFRSPHYNRKLGNARKSRHMFGDAADIYLDDFPQDGVMDDLNKNGKYDAGDALVLQQWIAEIERESEGLFPSGGLGIYKRTSAHGPFVHVDARGFNARWGLFSGKPEKPKSRRIVRSRRKTIRVSSR